MLRYYEALSDAEIAEVLGCAPGTVRGYASRALAGPAVKLIEDRQVTFVTPADAGSARGQVTLVCFRGSGQTGCGDGDVNTPAGTWSRFTALVSTTSDVGARGIFNPAALVRGIASGAWRVVARTRLDRSSPQ